MQLDIKKVHNTPYKLVLSNYDVVGLIENRDHKELYIEKKNFSAAHKKYADMYHAKSLPNRLKHA